MVYFIVDGFCSFCCFVKYNSKKTIQMKTVLVAFLSLFVITSCTQQKKK